jgi:putative transposase
MRKCTVFGSLLKLLREELIQKSAEIYESDAYYKRFTTKDHLICMMYAQLKEIKSLRDLEISLSNRRDLNCAVKKVSRSTLSDANRERSAKCFIWIAEKLMNVLPRKKKKELGKMIRILDSSPIQLKGKGYDEWTKETKTLRCQGMKLHVEYDPTLSIPIRTVTTAANYDDCRAGQNWLIESDKVYVFDKGYYDFNWWWSINQKGAFFVTRLKGNAAIKTKAAYPINEEAILSDEEIVFKNKCPRGGKKNLYQADLRRVVVEREGKEKPLILITNMMDVSAKAVADLYKSRWEIELFFKWIKQNLKIKKFLGRSENAVNIQLAVAMITYLLTFLFHQQFKRELSLRQTLVWITHNLHSKSRKYIYAVPPIYDDTDKKMESGKL